MVPIGRERRRKGPVNRIRRFCYGLLLFAAAPGAIAVDDELAHLGKYRSHPVAATPAPSVLVALQGLALLHADAGDDPGKPAQLRLAPHMTLDTVTARVPDEGADAPQFRIAVTGTDAPDGTAFDLPVPEFGSFRLDLHAHRSYAREATWSLLGTLELVRQPHGARYVVTVPELIVELVDLHTLYLPFQAALRRIGTPGQADAHAPELSFKWNL